jgi:hypothetical protein
VSHCHYPVLPRSACAVGRYCERELVGGRQTPARAFIDHSVSGMVGPAVLINRPGSSVGRRLTQEV